MIGEIIAFVLGAAASGTPAGRRNPVLLLSGVGAAATVDGLFDRSPIKVTRYPDPGDDRARPQHNEQNAIRPYMFTTQSSDICS